MKTKDYVLIDMAETSIKALGATVCIVSLGEGENANFAIQAASPIKRRERLVLDLAPHALYRVFKREGVADFSYQPDIVRDVDLLRFIERDLGLLKPLQSALQVPLDVDQRILGYLVFCEMRNWGRAPFTKEKIERAVDRASKVSDYLERKHAQ